MTARITFERFFDWAAQVDIPQVARLATTIDCWSAEALAYFRAGHASSGPVEAVAGEFEQFDRPARGFRNIHHCGIRMLLKTAVTRQTPTPKLRGRNGRSHPATPAFMT